MMANKKTISQKLRDDAKDLNNVADWFEKYEAWYETYQQTASTQDEGGQPGGPPPPPPPTGGFGGH